MLQNNATFVISWDIVATPKKYKVPQVITREIEIVGHKNILHITHFNYCISFAWKTRIQSALKVILGTAFTKEGHSSESIF